MTLFKIKITYIANEDEARFLGWHGSNLITHSEFNINEPDLVGMMEWCERMGYKAEVTTIFPNSPDYIKITVQSRALEGQRQKA